MPRATLTLAFVAAFLPSMAGAQPATPPADVTFSRDVAPILQKACQNCHRPGAIAVGWTMTPHRNPSSDDTSSGSSGCGT